MNAILRSLLTVVGVPTVLAIVYFGFIASDVYVSEARFAIKSAKSGGVATGLEALVANPIVSTGGKDTMVVADYAKSQDMMLKIQDRVDIRSHFSDSAIDVLSRLPDDAHLEEMLDYFRKHVQMITDPQSDVVTLKTRAYSPEVAQKIAMLVIELSENLVNDMSGRMEEDALATARAEVTLAEKKVKAASASVAAFRRTSSSLNPAAESSALLGIVSGLETRLIEARALLSEKKAYMREDSAVIVSLKNKISAISRQMSLEKGRLAGESDLEMGGLIETYQPLILEQELAQQQYASALSSLEIARIEAQRKKQYLVTFIQPSFPDDSVEPHRLNRILSVMIFSFLAYMLGGLMWSALKDHVGR
ncbi:MAG: hypothetical protein AB8B87_04710 [Granulosicoccus sp.]